MLLYWYCCFPAMFTLLHWKALRFCKIKGKKISSNKDIFSELELSKHSTLLLAQHYKNSRLRLFMSFQLLGKQKSGNVLRYIYLQSIWQLYKQNQISFCILIAFRKLIFKEVNLRVVYFSWMQILHGFVFVVRRLRQNLVELNFRRFARNPQKRQSSKCSAY